MLHVQSERYRRIALALLCLGQLICILDISIVNIAIPSIQKEMKFSSTSIQWLITAYVLTYGGFLLVGGRSGDLFGRRRMLLTGLAVFTVASAVGGVSANAATLLAARAGQGLGGAIITPTVMSFIAGLFPEGERRNRALGLLGAVTGAGFALGLVLGGLLTSTIGWRWVFFINLPIGIIVIVAALLVLPETERERRPVNVPSALAATLALALTVYTLTVSDPAQLVSGRTLSLIFAIGFLFWTFGALERRSDNRLIPAGLLTHPSMVRALLGSTTFGAVVGPSTLFLTLYLQNVNSVDPLRTGLAFLPQEVTVFLAANLAGRFVGRRGTSRVLKTGMLAFGVGSAWLATMPVTGGYGSAVVPGLLLVGLGIGSVNVAGSIAATEGVPPLQHGVSTGVWNTGNQIGTALGLAVLTTVANVQTTRFLENASGISENAAVVFGYRWAFIVAAGFALLGIVGLWIVRQRKFGDRPVPSLGD